ncbi:hypothetical protein AVEN_189824-1 [Araneus ventricosus]|uniref:Uncharacterized protein n=1 Tax=Araneus ventricosus TaxID=182803 RepID=A0A4Y2NR90_ARAVE|nr:hypothetical protein AVEN_189824-1 [Araneus ventricosus]
MQLMLKISSLVELPAWRFPKHGIEPRFSEDSYGRHFPIQKKLSCIGIKSTHSQFLSSGTPDPLVREDPPFPFIVNCSCIGIKSQTLLPQFLSCTWMLW